MYISKSRGLGAWLSQSLALESLAAAFGVCFLRHQRQVDVLQNVVFGCGEASPLEARFLPIKGKANVRSTAPHSEQPEPGAAGGGSSLQVAYVPQTGGGAQRFIMSQTLQGLFAGCLGFV